jgi:hypothetical protein
MNSLRAVRLAVDQSFSHVASALLARDETEFAGPIVGQSDRDGAGTASGKFCRTGCLKRNTAYLEIQELFVKIEALSVETESGAALSE